MCQAGQAQVFCSNAQMYLIVNHVLTGSTRTPMYSSDAAEVGQGGDLIHLSERIFRSFSVSHCTHCVTLRHQSVVGCRCNKEIEF